MSKKPSRSTFHTRLDEMVSTLRNQIITGQIESGQFLPSINQLSIQYQLSKNSVQKGIDQLTAESLIEKKERVGNRVRETRGSGTVTVRVGYFPSMMSEANLAHLFEHFEMEYPHIQLQGIPLSYDDYSQVLRDYFQNDLIDVISINQFFFRNLLDSDPNNAQLFEALELAEGTYPFLANDFMINNKPLVQPLIYSPVVLCYNMNHFAEKNLPEPDSSWTWDDLMRCANDISEGTDRLGFYFFPLSDNRWPIFLLQTGESFERDKRGKINLCGTKLIDGIQLCHDLIKAQTQFSSILSKSDSDAEELFLQEKISVIMTTYFAMNDFKEAKFPYDIAPLPHLYEPKTLLLTIGMAVNRRSKQKEAAKALVSYLASFSSQLHIRTNTLSIPALKKAAEWRGSVEGYRPSRFHIFREIVPTYSSLTDLKLRNDEFNRLKLRLKLYWSGLESKETFIEMLEDTL